MATADAGDAEGEGVALACVVGSGVTPVVGATVGGAVATASSVDVARGIVVAMPLGVAANCRVSVARRVSVGRGVSVDGFVADCGVVVTNTTSVVGTRNGGVVTSMASTLHPASKEQATVKNISLMQIEPDISISPGLLTSLCSIVARAAPQVTQHRPLPYETDA